MTMDCMTSGHSSHPHRQPPQDATQAPLWHQHLIVTIYVCAGLSPLLAHKLQKEKPYTINYGIFWQLIIHLC